MKTNVYVDGFNLYYGCLKSTRFKWLNIRRLCELILQTKHDIQRIRYFTAVVHPRTDDPHQQNRQKLYIRALETIPNLTVHYGRFLSHPKSLPLANPHRGGSRMAEVRVSEEKGSDVNLATFLLADGFRGDYEAAVVVSNDSDLKLPIRMINKELGLPVGVINPHSHPSIDLKKVSRFHLQIATHHIENSQFPSQLVDSKGKRFCKPSSW